MTNTPLTLEELQGFLATNTIPVHVTGLDFVTQQSLFLDGLRLGFPIAVGMCAIWAVVRVVRGKPIFPSE